MERSIQKNGLINLLTLLAVGVAGFAVARFANSLAGLVGVVFMGLGILVAAVSWFQMRLEENERLGEVFEVGPELRSRTGVRDALVQGWVAARHTWIVALPSESAGLGRSTLSERLCRNRTEGHRRTRQPHGKFS